MVKTITSSGHNFLVNKFTDTPPTPKPQKPPKNRLAGYRYLDDDFKKIFSMMECVQRDRSVKNRWEDESGNKYNHYIQYFCSRADCLSCKRAKTKRYLQNRIVKTKYFLTISTPITAEQVEREKDLDIGESEYKQFRRNIRLFFDHLEIPFIGALEFGDDGQKLHAHLLIQKTDRSSIELTHLCRGFFGYYNHSIIAGGKDGKLKDYLKKIIPYISKIDKDSELSPWNYTEIKQPIHYIFSNLYRAEPITLDQLTRVIPSGWVQDEVIITDDGGLDFGVRVTPKRFQVFEKMTNRYILDSGISNKKKQSPRRASMWVLGYLLRQKSNFLKDIENKIKKREYEKALDKQSLQGSVFRLTALPDPKQIELIVMEARRRILKGVVREYNRVVELSKEYNNVCEKYEISGDMCRVFSRRFFHSIIPKRLISNLSIGEEIKFKSHQMTGEKLHFITMKKMREKKEVDQDKHLHFISYQENRLFLRLRKDREKSERDFSNRIWINTVIKNNPVLLKNDLGDEIPDLPSKMITENTKPLSHYIDSAIDRMVSRQNGKKVDPEKFRDSLTEKVNQVKQAISIKKGQ